MSGQPYLAQDVLDEVREAWRQGRTLEFLAGQLRCDPEHLANLLGEPQWKSEPVSTPADDGFDLWAADRLESQL